MSVQALLLAYGAPQSFTTIFNPGLSENTAGFQQCTIRQRLSAALWSPAISGTKIRVTVQCATINALVMNDMFIDQRATSGNDWDYLTSLPTRITFNSGGTGFASISGGATKTSDDVTFPFDPTKNYVIGMDLGNVGATGSLRRILSFSDAECYYAVESNAAAQAPSGYATEGSLGNLVGISLIEVMP